MFSIKHNIYSNIIQKVFLFNIVLALTLVIQGRILVPTTSLLSSTGAFLILVIYGLIGYFVFRRIRPDILKAVLTFGSLAGIIFAGEILLEYVLLPKDNTSWGLIEFGGVFAVYFVSGLWVAYQSQSIKEGTLTAILTAMFSSVIWLIFLLLTFYIFRGTTRQELVFAAEGNLEDFARSGMNDFNTFVMEDFLGAGFFHLLLSPLFASIFGSVGSVLGGGIARFRKR